MNCCYFNLGFGGLGQMGAIMAKVMGNKVTVISTSNKKEEKINRQDPLTGILGHEARSVSAKTECP